MSKTLLQLAQHVGGEVIGNSNIEISSVATLESATAGQISFLANPKYTNAVETTKASAVIIGQKVETTLPLLLCKDPYYAFTQIVVLLHGHRKHEKTGIAKYTNIAPTAKIGDSCDIHNFATVGRDAQIGNGCIIYSGAFVGDGAKIGSGCILYPNATIYDGCELGNNVIINANATIGKDGYGYATHNGTHHKIPQIGIVKIEDDVEIGSNCCIQRGTLEDTIIGQGCKIGDLTNIGHGTKIGAHCLLIGQVAIAGSTTIGHHCVIAGQVGIVGHIKIGNLVKIGAQAGVVNSIPDGATVVGAPAIDANKAKRAYAMIEYLPEFRKSIKRLEKRLGND